jgi:hypothetical protein
VAAIVIVATAHPRRSPGAWRRAREGASHPRVPSRRLWNRRSPSWGGRVGWKGPAALANVSQPPPPVEQADAPADRPGHMPLRRPAFGWTGGARTLRPSRTRSSLEGGDPAGWFSAVPGPARRAGVLGRPGQAGRGCRAAPVARRTRPERPASNRRPSDWRVARSSAWPPVRFGSVRPGGPESGPARPWCGERRREPIPRRRRPARSGFGARRSRPG